MKMKKKKEKPKIIREIRLKKYIYKNGRSAYSIDDKNFSDIDEMVGFLERISSDLMERNASWEMAEESKEDINYIG